MPYQVAFLKIYKSGFISEATTAQCLIPVAFSKKFYANLLSVLEFPEGGKLGHWRDFSTDSFLLPEFC